LSNSLQQLPDKLRIECINGEPGSQKKLYYGFYGFAMGICLRYSKDRDEAVGILNDGFLKVLTRLESFDPAKPFLPWLSRIMTNTAVFNLFAIDGFSHEEISEKLGISIGTSKSNLFKARQKLRIMLEEQNKITALNRASNGAIIINEQFKSQQDRQIFQAGS
jgi:RNA polymerase sigma-70 factor (ECF subfamily)